MKNNSDFANSIEKMRKRLLDLTRRNNSISFRHSSKSKKQIRFVDKCADIIFEKLLNETELNICGLPIPDLVPEDEKTNAFENLVSTLKMSDHKYLQDLAELGESSNSRNLQLIEFSLRDRIRAELGMSPIERAKRPNVFEYAKKLGIDPAYDLPECEFLRTKSENCLQTLIYEDEQELVLDGLLDQRKLLESETGTEPLYLAIGFLEWFEADSSEAAILSPLLFLPVSISKEKDERKQKYFYKISLRDDEIHINSSLKERFKNDFDIVLPEIEVVGEDGTTYSKPSEYFSKLKMIIKEKKDWSIKRWSTLSFFSFTKLAMYQELEAKTLECIMHPDSPIYEVILGADTPRGDATFAEDYNLDSDDMKGMAPNIVSIADTSQISAIMDAAAGKNLVIEGPPGTGKSQTITNMIAALVNAGKTVLFIAEKRAALTVVNDRLTQCGLGRFCLELHSGKSKKTEILKSLNERIGTKKVPNPMKLIDIVEQIENVKQKIKVHLDFLHSRYEPLDKSLQEIMWSLLILKDRFSDLDSRIGFTQVNKVNDIGKWENDEIEMLLHTLSTDFANFISKFGSEKKHPWYGLVNRDLLAIQMSKFIFDMSNILPKISSLTETYGRLFNCDAGDLCRNVLMAKLNTLTTNLLKENLKLEWMAPFVKKHDENLLEMLVQVRDLFEKKESLVALVADLTGDNYRNLNTHSLAIFNSLISKNSFGDYSLYELRGLKVQLERELYELESDHMKLLNLAQLAFESGNREISSAHHDSQEKIVEQYQKDINDLNASLMCFDQVERYIHLSARRDTKALFALIELFHILKACPKDNWNLRIPQLFDITKITSLKKIYTDGIELQNKGETLKKKAVFDDSTDVGSLRKVVAELRNSHFLSFLNPNYRDAKSKALKVLRYKLDPKDVVQLVERLADYLDLKKEFLRSVEKRFGSEFQKGLKTKEDFLGLLNWINYVEEVRKHTLRFDFTEEFESEIFKLEPVMVDSFLSSISKFTYLKNSKALSVDEPKDILLIRDNMVQAFENAKFRNNIDRDEKIAKFQIEYDEKLVKLIENAKSEGVVKREKIEILEDVLKIGEGLKLSEDKKTSFFKVFAEYLNELLFIDRRLNDSSFEELNAKNKVLLELFASGGLEEVKKLYNLKNILNLDTEQVAQIVAGSIEVWTTSLHTAINSLMESSNSIQDVGLGYNVALIADGNVQYDKILHRIKNAIEHKAEIQGFVQYLQSKSAVEAKKFFLSDIISLLSKEEDLVPYSGKIYQLCYYVGVITEFANKNPSQFRSVSTTFDELRHRFRSLDDQLTKSYRVELSNALLDKPVPPGISSGRKSEYSELGLLNYQINLKRPSVSVRSLMKRSGNAIQSLKPIFLMSPLSVARLLPGNVKFDVVIMDEASQLRPEDSIGSIARAKQVVIVGDPKQMPPSDFFNKNIADDDAEGSDVGDEDIKEESILDLGLNVFKPARRLKWHYRSRSEELIAFSNYHFYENGLIIFPAANKGDKQFGVSYRKVDKSVYNKGLNPIEAKQVVLEAVDLIHQNPNRTLMIVAVNKAQSELIQELLNEVEKHDPIIEQYRAKYEDSLEPLIVRNLETVQGDERDIVIISTVYGRDSNGQMFQRFGPINSEYGHRRLNVLFTRAKYHMLVVSSLDPDEIVVDVRSKQGVVAFKNFLNFAKTKKLGTENTFVDREPDSDFERFVAAKLQQKMPALKIVPQVGVAGFFVDIGVRHPSKEGSFILGIECDGKTYHSAKSARDRDKIRQKVLEDLGWNIHRIWSTDWFNNPDLQITKLVEKIMFLLSKETG